MPRNAEKRKASNRAAAERRWTDPVFRASKSTYAKAAYSARRDTAEGIEHRALVCSRVKALRSSADTWPAQNITTLKARARLNKLPFDLVASDIAVPDVCPVLGTAFIFGGGRNHPQGPSVDRVIPALGYVRGNVYVISNRANTLKRDCLDPNELRRVADYMENHK